MRAGIVADDLTGACDTGAVFAARGLATIVLLPGAPLPASLPDVLVMDTESRGQPAGEARSRAREATAGLAAAGPALLYKKVDSTLRGALAAELAGALDGDARAPGGARPCPCPPSGGPSWTARCGSTAARRRKRRSRGIRDSRHGRQRPRAAGRRRRPSRRGSCRCRAVRRGVAAVAARLARISGCLVCDAETDADLAILAAAADETSALLAGSAGFASALAARMPGQPGTRPRFAGPCSRSRAARTPWRASRPRAPTPAGCRS